MKVAILSFAHMHALSYAHAVQKSGVDFIISDFDEARGRDMASQFNTPYVKDYHDVLADDDIDAVIVCSENETTPRWSSTLQRRGSTCCAKNHSPPRWRTRGG